MSEKTPPICSYEGSDYQQRFWDEGGRSYEDAVEAIAIKRLLPPNGDFMLELGAGAGRNTLRYKNYKRVALLDYSRTQLVQARDRLGNSDQFLYIAADVYHLPFISGRFDGATMIRTLHHMADPALALAQVARVMAPG
ncbi:MAG: class I SAM-dependent methyltransferase, partial [Chloroflexota bacterium]|nr:class I SAM-dependent methyltransferase [Chloroflexota bacterium]